MAAAASRMHNHEVGLRINPLFSENTNPFLPDRLREV
jgi:hypothetical protein